MSTIHHSHGRLYLLTLEPPCGYSECTRSTNSWEHSKTLLKGLASVPGTRRGSCSGIKISLSVEKKTHESKLKTGKPFQQQSKIGIKSTMKTRSTAIENPVPSCSHQELQDIHMTEISHSDTPSIRQTNIRSRTTVKHAI
ncbi:hypothetical protein DAPPUDRAFT_265690 [Daphnia pulex]|uniref:Uncharacterized protein n=1 Tax=Daphnia pulex TaxID=6669 RepID=E9HTV2_DAPPU|nr:hypothetical protein DAPPUDRAFT_265690 [Daphnia pulex]|eukprot:EFX64822.1 hypothetical protein DAPPUDRAFT_265690 [Daphnia pulex]